jgi:hypothetical protein
MSSKNPGPVHTQLSSKGILQKPSSHVRVDSTQDIIQHQNLSTGVESPSQSYTPLLAAAEACALLPDHGPVTVCQAVDKVLF